MKRFETAVALFLLAATTCLYAAGALRTDPGTAIAANDLEILRDWQKTGRITDLSNYRWHLPKLGYLILLRRARAISDSFRFSFFLPASLRQRFSEPIPAWRCHLCL